MNTFDHPPTAEEIQDKAFTYWKIWQSRSRWLARKTSQFEYFDKTTIEHSASYDVNIAEIIALVKQSPSESQKQERRLLIPLDILEEYPDHVGAPESPWGRHACIASSGEVASFAVLMFFGILSEEYAERGETNYTTIDNSIAKEIYESFLDETDDAEFDRCLCVELGHDEDEDIKRIMQILSWLRQSYFVLLSVPVDNVCRARVDLSYLSSRRVESRNWFDRLGITASSIFMPDILRNEDYDVATSLTITVPDGMRVDDVTFEWPPNQVDSFNSSSDKELARVKDTSRIDIRCNGRYAHIVSPFVRFGPILNLRVYMNPKRGIFTIPAFVACFVSYAVGQIVFYWISNAQKETVFPATAISPIAALVPAFIASYVLVTREHERLTFALGFRRTLLGAGAVSSVIFSVTLALGMADGSADWRAKIVLFAYTMLQSTLLLFFAFDTVRVEFWRQQCARKNVWIGITLVVVIAIWAVALRWNCDLWK